MSATKPSGIERTMKHPRAMLFGFILLAGVIAFAWPHVDRTGSKVALAASGLSLILAWYSILDMKEQRKERWPQTIDRLVRATFVSLTLAFVLNITIPPSITKPVETRIEVHEERFVDDLYALLRDHKWDQGNLDQKVAEHFGKLTGKGDLYLQLPEEHALQLRADGRGVMARLVH